MKWNMITAMGAGSLVMAGFALLLAARAVPLAIQLEDPTAIVSEACAKGQVAQCAKDREHARNRMGLMLNGAGVSVMLCLLLGGIGTFSLAKQRREERDKGPPGPQLWGPKWEDQPDEVDIFRK